MRRYNKTESRLIELWSTSATKYLLHVQNPQVDERAAFGIINICALNTMLTTAKTFHIFGFRKNDGSVNWNIPTIFTPVVAEPRAIQLAEFLTANEESKTKG
uniref:Uncharacterized protein n=1 Tax=Romanomermis culicivorax TaxID=13658 RepID=A0A915JGB0_ROMCU